MHPSLDAGMLSKLGSCELHCITLMKFADRQQKTFHYMHLRLAGFQSVRFELEIPDTANHNMGRGIERKSSIGLHPLKIPPAARSLHWA